MGTAARRKDVVTAGSDRRWPDSHRIDLWRGIGWSRQHDHICRIFNALTPTWHFLTHQKPLSMVRAAFKGRAGRNRHQAASVDSMSDGARDNGDGGNAHTDEAALSARLKRLSERLAREQAGRASNGAGEDRATTASGYAKGFRLSSELVAGVLVGGGIGWLIDHWLGIAPWGLIVFLLLGFAAGVLNVMRSAGVVPGNSLDCGAVRDRDR
jgi:ATP synthase protein I